MSKRVHHTTTTLEVIDTLMAVIHSGLRLRLSKEFPNVEWTEIGFAINGTTHVHTSGARLTFRAHTTQALHPYDALYEISAIMKRLWTIGSIDPLPTYWIQVWVRKNLCEIPERAGFRYTLENRLILPEKTLTEDMQLYPPEIIRFGT